ncbi:Uncharacterised protein [Mycobacteroides abscessus subsp. abscessus]|nr:Uncharacterised protein [Mycobacteroides abscessus subsp. abscessus]SKV16085.1 Uncharacterised protein [Mycobacteroides abscessus subsp. abscessus]
MVTLLESDSWNSRPMFFIAFMEGASEGLSETAFSWPTCSSWGAARARMTTSATQPMTMGTDRRRIHVATKVGSPFACAPLMRTSQSSRRRRSPRWYTSRLFSRHWP